MVFALAGDSTMTRFLVMSLQKKTCRGGPRQIEDPTLTRPAADLSRSRER